MATMSKQKVLRQLGAKPEEIANELKAFAKTARVLSSNHPRLINTYPRQWVGLYRGRVAAHATTLPALMKRLSRANIPSEKAIIRYIDNDPRTLIL
jgi:hypothetical protein